MRGNTALAWDGVVIAVLLVESYRGLDMLGSFDGSEMGVVGALAGGLVALRSGHPMQFPFVMVVAAVVGLFMPFLRRLDPLREKLWSSAQFGFLLVVLAADFMASWVEMGRSGTWSQGL